jgi:geranylgeranyl pyrophosphate synthase
MQSKLLTTDIYAFPAALSPPSARPQCAAAPLPILPTRADLGALVSVPRAPELGGVLEDILSDVLFQPIRDLAARPGKRFRSRLVTHGFSLLSADADRPCNRRRCRLGGEAVELIHAGSLMVDDIEDGSRFRRGAPAIHRRYGVPIALNAGNWLYFWPVELLRRLRLTPGQELLIGQYYYRTLLKAHYGQALDVGLALESIEQRHVADVCLAAMELKTGALVALALSIGAILARASGAQLARVEEFGLRLGVALQMFDDIGNLRSRRDPAKRFEDLALRRPSWVWACVAKCTSPAEFREFTSRLGRLPDAAPVAAWLESSGVVERAKREAREFLADASGVLESAAADLQFRGEAVVELHDLGRTVALAYD